MTRSLLPFLLGTVIAAQATLADDLLPSPPSSQSPAQSPPAQSPQSPPAGGPSQTVADARAACANDIQKLCAGVQPGGGRIIACLKQHKEAVSDGCKQAVVKAKQGSN